MSLPSKLQVIRLRLVDIINSKFQEIHKKSKMNESKLQYLINEAKLQDWVEMIDEIVTSMSKVKKDQANNKRSSNLFKGSITLEKPRQDFLNPLLKIEGKSIQILMEQFKQQNQFSLIKQKVQFQKQIIKKHSSINVISKYKAIFIGGCSQANPNIKSSQILQFCMKNGEIYEIGKLPYGISSHNSIQIQNYIYVIGGNRDHAIISRGCFRFSLLKKTVQQISCLSYPASSMCLVNWKNVFIYKFGGVGQCFEEWGLSPYIERYSINNNYWQTINPEISSKCKTQFENYNLMINSFGYATQTDKIIIFGGFNLQGEPQDTGFVMKIENYQDLYQKQQENSKVQDHVIQNIGQIQGLSKGGFINNQFIYSNIQKIMHICQRKVTKQRNYFQQFIQLKIEKDQNS